jgi:hypothetical protein
VKLWGFSFTLPHSVLNAIRCTMFFGSSKIRFAVPRFNFVFLIAALGDYHRRFILSKRITKLITHVKNKQ